MGRLLEATQFQMQDFESFKTGTKFESKAKQRAMELLVEAEKDPKHEINTVCGGVSNVKRVRVLKDSDDAELKDLKLTFELKTPEKEIRRQKSEEESKIFEEKMRLERLKNKQFPVFFSDARATVISLLSQTADEAEKAGMPEGLFKALRLLSEALEVSAMRQDEIDETRVMISELIAFSDEEGETEPIKAVFKAGLFRRLDKAQALLCFLLDEKAFDKEELLAYAKKLQPAPRPQQNRGPPKARPPQRPRPSNLPPMKALTPPQA